MEYYKLSPAQKKKEEEAKLIKSHPQSPTITNIGTSPHTTEYYKLSPAQKKKEEEAKLLKNEHKSPALLKF